MIRLFMILIENDRAFAVFWLFATAIMLLAAGLDRWLQ